jgi:hypothetical protein
MSTATRWRADQSANGDRNQIVRAVQDERRHANRRQDAGDVDLDVELVHRVDAKFRFRAPSSGYETPVASWSPDGSGLVRASMWVRTGQTEA